jgi:hypothetical protein
MLQMWIISSSLNRQTEVERLSDRCGANGSSVPQSCFLRKFLKVFFRFVCGSGVIIDDSHAY